MAAPIDPSKLLIAISESRKPRQNSARHPGNAGLEILTTAEPVQHTERHWPLCPTTPTKKTRQRPPVKQWRGSRTWTMLRENQQNPCVELYRNPSAGIAGALLVNKCSAQTWVLVGTGPARWYPISTSREEYVAPVPR